MSLDTLKKKIHQLLSGEDLTRISLKKVRCMLSDEPYSISEEDVTAQKDVIKGIVQEYVVAQQQKEDDEDEEDGKALLAAPTKRVITTTNKAINRKRFLENADDLDVTIPGMGGHLTLEKRKFSTGSCGWHGTSKVNANIDNVPLTVQCHLTLTVVGSKEWDE